MRSPENVVVGETYDVPCQLSTFEGWIPIMYPSHRDGPDFCFDQNNEHYHIDRRFTNDHKQFAAWHKNSNERIELRKLICLRENATSFTDSAWPFAIVKMHEVFANHTLKNKTCPHQGLKVTNSCGTCPGHGLIWNLQTNKLKYTLPFYFTTPDLKHRGEIRNGRCTIHFDEDTMLAAGTMLRLVDKDGNVYPRTGFKLEHRHHIVADDKLTITDTHCGRDDIEVKRTPYPNNYDTYQQDEEKYGRID